MERLRAVHRSLQGLALGDALGQALVNAPTSTPEFDPAPWAYSDDTEMAIAIAHVLHRYGRIDQDALAALFGQRFLAAPERGYGAVAYWILSRISIGDRWQDVARTPFDGRGSLGNGGAMRVAPLGVYFAADLDRVVVEAERSAAVTHAHPEGQAGAAAVALAAAYAHMAPDVGLRGLRDIAARLPPSDLRALIEQAASMGDASAQEAGRALGTGVLITAADTVPFALWCAFSHPLDFRAAQLAAIEGFESWKSDRDTICAIIGGIVGVSCDPSTIPEEWKAQQEPLPDDVRALFA